jgi:hypothetical protein
MAGIQRTAGERLPQAGIVVRWWNCRVARHSACAEDDATHFVVAVLPERMSRKIASNPNKCGLAATSRASGFPTHAYVF